MKIKNYYNHKPYQNNKIAKAIDHTNFSWFPSPSLLIFFAVLVASVTKHDSMDLGENLCSSPKAQERSTAKTCNPLSTIP